MRPIFRWPTPRSVLLFCALAVAMILMNLALPRHEPVAFMLLFAALVCGRNPYAAVLAYLLSSITALSWMATLSMAAQGCILLLAFVLSRTFRREPGPERIAYAAAAQIPFIFLFPHEGYALLPFPVIAQKCILALFSCSPRSLRRAACARFYSACFAAAFRARSSRRSGFCGCFWAWGCTRGWAPSSLRA